MNIYMNIYLYFCTIQGDKGTLIFFINKLLQKNIALNFRCCTAWHRD